MTKKRLGRGLAALLGPEDGGFEPGSVESADLIQLAVDQIDPNPFQPRAEFDPADLAALADSIRQHGMLQPVLVRPAGDRYQLIAGERRHRAAIEAKLHEIPARVMELDDRRVGELAMVENLQREDLNAMEKARAFRSYLDTYGGTQDDLARRLGIDRSTVANLIRLLDLPGAVQEAVRAKRLSMGHARALLALESPEAQVDACARVIAEGLSVRATEALVQSGDPTLGKPRRRVDGPEVASTPAGGKAPHLVELEGRLRERFGTPVLIRARRQGRGQIVIDYASEEEFDRITALIRG